MIIFLFILGWFMLGLLAVAIFAFCYWWTKSDIYIDGPFVRISMLLGLLAFWVSLIIFIISLVATFVCWSRPEGFLEGLFDDTGYY